MKIGQKKCTLHEDQYTFSIIFLSFLPRMKNISGNFRENRNTHLINKICFRKSCRLWENVEKICRAGQATYNTAQAYCMLDN